MQTRSALIRLTLVAAGFAASAAAPAQPYSFREIVFPGASVTEGFGFNNAGDVTGVHSEERGFLIRGSEAIDFLAPGSNFTELSEINDQGVGVGLTFFPDNTSHAFVRAADGTITYLPDIVPNPTLHYAFGINNGGDLVGLYSADPTYETWSAWTYDDGTFTPYSVPGALRTQFNKINDAGAILGRYADAEGVNHGFLLEGDTFTQIDVPGADSTSAFGLNNLGHISGYYTVGTEQFGFVLRDGVFETVTLPGLGEAAVYDINDHGQLLILAEERTFVATPVPEPASVVLVAVGLGLLVVRGRRYTTIAATRSRDQ